MTKEEQKLIRIKLDFVSFGQIKGKMYWFNDGKKKRLFALPGKGVSTKLIYGGLFKIDEYELQKHRLHAYYYNSLPFTEHNFIEDMYVFKKTIMLPIRFNSLTSLKQNNYIKGEPIECEVFFGNPNNRQIQYNASKHYYKLGGVDTKNFITMIKEQK